MNDYDCEIHHRPGKANKVADALSRKLMAYDITTKNIPVRLQRDLYSLEMEVIIGSLFALTIQPTIMEAIKRGQLVDLVCEELKQEVRKGK